MAHSEIEHYSSAAAAVSHGSHEAARVVHFEYIRASRFTSEFPVPFRLLHDVAEAKTFSSSDAPPIH